MHRGIIAAALLVAGCATSKTVYLPDGSKGHTVNCDGAALSWNMCYQKAGQLCKAAGYEIVARQGEETPTATATQYGAFSGAAVTRSLMIKCKSEAK
jgi:hypothetical protein